MTPLVVPKTLLTYGLEDNASLLYGFFPFFACVLYIFSANERALIPMEQQHSWALSRNDK